MVSNQPKTVVSVSLARVIEDSIALVSMAGGGPRPVVKARLGADAKTVRADRIQVQQVLINLIRNACDATAGRDDAEIVVSSARDGENVAVTVEDDGPGFSQPPAERFSPFATTRAPGLGLGLSISRTIIEAHGGRIWTEDREGGGARVGSILPAPRRHKDRRAAAAG